MKKTAIIGFGRAGYAAAEALRRCSYDGEIHVFNDDITGPQNPMLTTYYASGYIPVGQVTPFGGVEPIRDSLRLTFHKDTRVTRVMPESMSLSAADRAGAEHTCTFDDIVIATGSEPVIPDVQAAHSAHVIAIRNIGDAVRMHTALLTRKKALVVGASMIGIKVVQALQEFNCEDITMADFADTAFPTAVLKEASPILHERITEQGVRLLLNTGIREIRKADTDCRKGKDVEDTGDAETVKDIEDTGDAEAAKDIEDTKDLIEVEFTTGRKECYNSVFLCMGTRARTAIADGTGIRTDRAFLVDEHQRTNYPHIYAAGDCACAYEISTGTCRNVSLWANAGEQGRIAGENIAGIDSTYGGNLFCNITHFWNTDFVSIGNNRAKGQHIRQQGNGWSFFAVVSDERIECVNIIDNPALSGVFKNLMQKSFTGGKTSYPMTEYNLERFGLNKDITDLIYSRVRGAVLQENAADTSGAFERSRHSKQSPKRGSVLQESSEETGTKITPCRPVTVAAEAGAGADPASAKEQDAYLQEKIKAKIPGEDTGIEIRKTFCDICTPLNHCGIDAYVKDDKVLKIEGTIGHPMNDGKLCTKGACNRSYIYRPDRLKTPLRRVGERGEGKFEEISWEEAFHEIAERMLACKEQYGPNSVFVYSGYSKGYRFMLQRLAHDFGTVNYGTESSACFTAGKMAWMLNTGKFGRPDMPNANLFVAWASPTHHSRFTNGNAYDAFHKRGGIIISIDPRKTTISERDADLHLQIRPGTDGLLANGIAGHIIRSGKHDREYIRKYVHGFDKYAEYVCSLDLEEVSRVTTIPVDLIIQAADMIAEIKPMSVENSPISIMHQTNGLQSIRAIIALSIITGNYNTPGGNTCLDFTFCEQGAGFHTGDEEFAIETIPADFDKNRTGAKRFPLWNRLTTQANANDFCRQVIEETPYPIKCVYAHGMNHYMFSNTAYTEEALRKLDFFADVDLFLTDTAKFADIVLPACSSFEREEFKVYPGGRAAWYTPVIPPYYEARSDFDIISGMSRALGIDDEYLNGGYRKCMEHVLEGTGLDIDEMAASDLPVQVPIDKPKPYSYVDAGCDTPTGKLELYSEVIAEYADEYHLNPLPVYEPPARRATKEYPFILQTGVRIPGAIHSRLHKVNWTRALRPDPMVDISLEDAERMQIHKGDPLIICNPNGELHLKANPTASVQKGHACLFHGYSEANAAVLLYKDAFDPYSGFPSYKSVICDIKKCEGTDEEKMD